MRHYGFHSRNSNVSLDNVRQAIGEHGIDDEPDLQLKGWEPPSLVSRELTAQRCPHCGSPLEFRRVIRPGHRNREPT